MKKYILFAAIFFSLPAISLASTEVSGTLTGNQTWTVAGGPYLASYVSVPAGVTLTIEPGAVVKFKQSAQIVVSGTLIANGSEGNEIYFTSVNDNEIGGATGTGTPKPADWDKISIGSGASADISHAVIRYGGFACCWTPMIRANVYNNGGNLSVANSVIAFSDGDGIQTNGGTTSLVGNTIRNNSANGISARGTGTITITGNTFSGNAGNAVYADTNGGLVITNSGNSGSNGINLNGTMNADQTLSSDGIPYLVSYFTVPEGKTLTINPGTVIKFLSTGSQLVVSGNLNAIGTSDNQIYFTSINDNEVGGATGTGTPKPADWDKINISSTGKVNLKYSVVLYGGFACCWTPMIRANIYNQGGTLNISNSIVSGSDGNGIEHSGGTTTVIDSTISNNSGSGVSGRGSGSLSFADSIFSGNVGDSVYAELSGGLSLSNSGNAGTGGINLYGTMNADQTLVSDGIPYLISYLTVPAGKTLTFQEGSVIKFKQSSILAVNGTLNANGTNNRKVYFTSIKDDGISGDTNGDATATNAAPADWDKISLSSSGTANFAYSVVRFGGFACCWTPMIHANIYNNGGNLTIASSTISFSDGNGIEHNGGATYISGSTINENRGNGIYGYGNGTLFSNGNLFSGNQGGAGYIEYSSGLIFSNLNNTANGVGLRGFTVRGTVNSDQTWAKDNIPYIISYLVVPSGKILTINPGAIIKFNPSSVLNVNGSLNTIGTDADWIYFTSLKDDDIGGDTNGDGNTTSPAPADWDKIAIGGGIANFDHAVVRYGGFACCWTPMIRANIYNQSGTLSVLNSLIGYSDGNGIEHANGTTTVNFSTIWHNRGYGVYNSSAKTIDAKNNFWGSGAGPNHNGLPIDALLNDKVSDRVDYFPWLNDDPTSEKPKCTTNCYSNVMFLPGIMGSTLYDGAGKEIWLSDNDTEADYLRMDENGASVNSDISTKNAMSTAGWNRLDVNIYKSFLAEMRDWETAYSITATTTPYDWRLDYDTVVSKGKKLSSGNISYITPLSAGEDPYLVATLKHLAETSKTGKVTIIAHSQGGLITKVLTKKLGADASKYIDKIVMVATPQLGTPQAFAQIMNGTDARIPSTLSAQKSRQLSQNMQSAYNLLPSGKYFTYVDKPVAILSTTTPASWQTAYGNAIHWDQGMYNFMSDTANARMKPAYNDLANPEIANPVMLSRAKAVHDEMDNWVPPTGVEFVTVSGWGNETLAWLEYYGKKDCTFAGLNDFAKPIIVVCSDNPHVTVTPKKVIDGDGTVVEPSAQFANGQESTRYWVDLNEYNNEHQIQTVGGWLLFDHKKILEVPELRTLLTNILTNGTTPFPDQYISTVASAYHGTVERLHFILHSPLTLEFYDSLGNHTGYSSSIGDIEYNIPGVEYERYGETQWLSVPKDVVGTLTMRGTANGSFDLQIEDVNGNNTVSKTSFETIPSGTSTVVTMNISPAGSVTASGILSIDFDGNGSEELALTAKQNGIVSFDQTAPVISVQIPSTNQEFILNETASAVFTATDDSGIASITPKIKTLDTFSVGPKNFIVIATDNNGNTSSTTVSYFVRYSFGGILQPVNVNGTSIFKLGSTVPVKFQLKDANQSFILTAIAKIYVTKISNGILGIETEAVSTSAATSGNLFRYDATGNQYIFNLSTKSLSTGTWQIRITLDDGTSKMVNISLR